MLINLYKGNMPYFRLGFFNKKAVFSHSQFHLPKNWVESLKSKVAGNRYRYRYSSFSSTLISYVELGCCTSQSLQMDHSSRRIKTDTFLHIYNVLY